MPERMRRTVKNKMNKFMIQVPDDVGTTPQIHTPSPENSFSLIASSPQIFNQQQSFQIPNVTSQMSNHQVLYST